MAPLPKGAVPTLRRHQSGQAFVTLSGRSYYCGKWGSPESHTRYGELIGQWLAGGRKPMHQVPEVAPAQTAPTLFQEPPSADMTMVELLARWIASLEASTGRPTTDRDSPAARSLDVARRLMAAFGREPAKDFGPVKLRLFRESLIATGLVRRSINQHINRVKSAFRWAVAEELLHPEVYQKIAALENLRQGRSAAKESKRVLPAPEADIEATIAELNPVVADLVRLLLVTGARPGEICSMRPCDIDRSGTVWVYRPRRHKTEHHGKQRAIMLGPKSQTIVAPYLVDRSAETAICRPEEAEAIARKLKSDARRTPMSCGNRPGSKPRKGRTFKPEYTKDSLYHCVMRAADRAGVPRWHVYQLRHTAATRIRSQHGLDAASVILGHTNPRSSGSMAGSSGGHLKPVREDRLPMAANWRCTAEVYLGHEVGHRRLIMPVRP